MVPNMESLPSRPRYCPCPVSFSLPYCLVERGQEKTDGQLLYINGNGVPSVCLQPTLFCPVQPCAHFTRTLTFVAQQLPNCRNAWRLLYDNCRFCRAAADKSRKEKRGEFLSAVWCRVQRCPALVKCANLLTNLPDTLKELGSSFGRGVP
jgi:hypothetical protein